MRKKRVLILQGGNNEEHEISLMTAKEVNNALIDLNYSTELLLVNPSTFENDIINHKMDYCFNALHGAYGEDGKIQRVLLNLNIPFTHSGVLASYKSFNKYQTKICLKNTITKFCQKNTKNQ